MVNRLSVKDKNIFDYFRNLNVFTITSTSPIHLTKGASPNFLYEQYRLSPFVHEKKLVIFSKRIKNERISIDFGKKFLYYKKNNFEL